MARALALLETGRSLEHAMTINYGLYVYTLSDPLSDHASSGPYSLPARRDYAPELSTRLATEDKCDRQAASTGITNVPLPYKRVDYIPLNYYGVVEK